MSLLWNWETCLPGPKRSHACASPHHIRHPHARPGIQNPNPFPISHPSSLHQGKKPSNRASSSLIKANDEKANYHHNERQRRGLIPAQGNALGTHRNIASSPERASHPANQGRKPLQSRQIVLHQGKPEISHRIRPSHPGTPPSASIRVYLRSNSPFAFLASFAVTPPGGRPPEPLRLCVKTPAIVPHQASSRHPMKKLTTTIMSANGAALYQPRATPWVRTHYATSPERASHPANQGGKPQQSRPIVPHQGIRQKMKTPPAKPLP